jgi:hypothetical protein
LAIPAARPCLIDNNSTLVIVQRLVIFQGPLWIPVKKIMVVGAEWISHLSVRNLSKL